MTKARDKYREVMRDHLIESARIVLARKGFAQTTVRDILAEAEVATATLYSHFAGKDELLQALAECTLNAHLATLNKGGETWTAERLFIGMLGMALSEPPTVQTPLVELRAKANNAADAEAVRRWNGLVITAMRPLFHRMRDDGALDVDDPDSLIELLDIIWDGMKRRAEDATFITSYERVGALCIDILRRSVLRQSEPVPA